MLSLALVLAVGQGYHAPEMPVAEFPAYMHRVGVEVKLVDAARGWWSGDAKGRHVDMFVTPENGTKVSYADARVTFQANKVIDRLDLAALLARHPDTPVELHSYLNGEVHAILRIRFVERNEDEMREDVQSLVAISSELERGPLREVKHRQFRFGEKTEPLPIDENRKLTSLESGDMDYLIATGSGEQRACSR